MKILKSLISSVLVGTYLVMCTVPVYADNSIVSVDKPFEEESSSTETANTNASGVKVESDTVNVDDLNVQLNDLYMVIGSKLNVDQSFVKITHLIAGGKAVYAEEIPNIYNDVTVDNLSGPFDIAGASTVYDRTASWVDCPDKNVVRPNKYYLPDAAYNVMSDIVKLMNVRYKVDRGDKQEEFDNLTASVKKNIIYSEAILEYCGAGQYIDKYYDTYTELIAIKRPNENVVEMNESGTFVIKSKFREVFTKNGITDENVISKLVIIYRFDKELADCALTQEIIQSELESYVYGYQSRENMMLAAFSLIGKVRYVWGGGHLGTANIVGINPNWKLFYNSYGDEPDETGYMSCVRPNTTWCPIHGNLGSTSDSCTFKSSTIYDSEQFINERKDAYDTTLLGTKKFADIINRVVAKNGGVSSHRFDGLDCSGFCNWVYNQVSGPDVVFDSSAQYFVEQSGIKKVNFGTKLLPGDVFAWSTHIIMIVGAVNDDNKAYVIMESAPNQVKFGVGYYKTAKYSDIEYARDLASEANTIFGNISKDENVNCFCFDNYRYTYKAKENSYDKNGTIDDTSVVASAKPLDDTADVPAKHSSNEFIANMPNFALPSFTIVETDDGSEFDYETMDPDTYDSSSYTKIENKCIGRLSSEFLDEKTIVRGYGKTFVQMNAQGIIQNTSDNIPSYFISGIDTYDGTYFYLERPDISTLSNKDESEDSVEEHNESVKYSYKSGGKTEEGLPNAAEIK